MATLFVSAARADITRNFLLVDMYTVGVGAAQWNYDKAGVLRCSIRNARTADSPIYGLQSARI